MTTPPRLVVTAAVIEEHDRFLLTRRPRGTHLEGFWEFPGGKCDAGESLTDGLAREIDEELGCGVIIGGEIFGVAHAYPDRVVELHFFACALDGVPHPKLGQEMRWVERSELQSLDFPPADAELIARLSAPADADRPRPPSPRPAGG
jgi:8-oxo-dGTP diphosphatase